MPAGVAINEALEVVKRFGAGEAPVAACAGCHIAEAHDDMVFSGFYRQLRVTTDNAIISDSGYQLVSPVSDASQAWGAIKALYAAERR